jgi:hypothetical protein
VRADGSVGCLGDQYLWGLLGDGSYAPSAVPVQPQGLPSTTAMTATPQFTCGLLADGAVRCWGYNRDNQLGDGGPHDAIDFGPVLGTP